MPWKKAPPELISFLDITMETYTAERKMMFGFPVYFINGNMFMGLFEDQLFLRLGEEAVKSLQSQGDPLVCLEPMKGRPMKNYVVIPEKLYRDQKVFREIVSSACDYAKTLKPKEKKSKK